MGKAIFITGTGTDVGKSALSVAVLVWARGKGLKAVYCKPVQCGETPSGDPPSPRGDADWIRAVLPFPVPVSVTYAFRSPVSPHLAAERENAAIDPERIRKDLESLMHANDLVVAEGAGGAAVPLDRRGGSLAALAGELDIPSLVACSPGLGTLHHTLATLAFLERLACPVAGFAFCHRERKIPGMYPDNVRTLAELAGRPCFGAVPFSPALARGLRLSPSKAAALADPLAPSLDAWWNKTPA